MTQFGPFTLGIVALFLFLIISVSANQKKVPEKIVTKMSLGEYCNFFKKPFCSLPDLDVVVIVVTTSGIDDTCAGELIKKAENEYGIKFFGVFNFGINSYPQESENRFRYLDTKVMCYADFLIKE
jgi:hypothetical protein